MFTHFARLVVFDFFAFGAHYHMLCPLLLSIRSPGADYRQANTH
jgi:hypothetical protein